MKQRRWRRTDVYATDANRLLTIQDVAKIIRKADDFVVKAMDLWTQTHGQRGLRYIIMGKRRNIRYGSLNEWLSKEEEAMACRTA